LQAQGGVLQPPTKEGCSNPFPTTYDPRGWRLESRHRPE